MGQHGKITWKEDNSSDLHHPSVFEFLTNTINTVDCERNLSNIEETTAINISTKTDVVENIHVGKSCSSSELEIYSTLFREFRDVFPWSYDEMPGIDSSTVEHEIKMYPDVKPVRQRLRQVHPKKVIAIKAEVEKLLHAGLLILVSKDGIHLDPCKVQAIINLPPPSNLLQIEKLQGKENFLRRFIPNYAKLAKGYTRLLKKEVPFVWDQVAQASFDALKKSLIQASLMYAPDYQKDFNLYLAAADMTITMLLGGKYSKWIAILQEFDLEFKKSKSKKALVFAELPCDLPSSSNDATSEEVIVDENLFLISSSDLWYGDIIIYLQTQTYRSNTSRFEQRHIRYQAKNYVIVSDTLYRRGIDTVLRRCLTLEEAEKVPNDCHSGACGGHQSGSATRQIFLRAGYFWPTMFKDCITAVRSCHACQIFNSKTKRPPAPLQPVVVVGPFTKWGIDFMTCNPTSAGGHGYIIVAVDYFTKWAEAMPTLNNSGETAALFFFNHVVSKFSVPQAIVTDHGSHFRNHMMVELAAKLGLSHHSFTPYYPQANEQVEAINKVLKCMRQRMIGVHKRDWYLILYSALWAYRTSVRNATGFTPFQLVYGLEEILPV
eukprot:PITA_26101